MILHRIGFSLPHHLTALTHSYRESLCTAAFLSQGVICCIYYSCFRSSNYHERLTLSVNKQQCCCCIFGELDKGNGCCGLEVDLAAIHISEAAGENESSAGERGERGCFALKQSSIAVRISHGWDVPIHSILESCLSMQLPIGPALGLPVLIWTI